MPSKSLPMITVVWRGHVSTQLPTLNLGVVLGITERYLVASIGPSISMVKGSKWCCLVVSFKVVIVGVKEKDPPKKKKKKNQMKI